jgi:hypothetical protein
MAKQPVLDEKGGRKGHCLGCGKDLVMGSCPSDCPCGVAYEVENDYDRGVREERARIVAWMRTGPVAGPAETVYADAIEHGKHGV